MSVKKHLLTVCFLLPVIVLTAAEKFAIVKNGKSCCQYVIGKETYDKLAKQEFQELMKLITGAVGEGSGCKVYIGKSDALVKALDKARVDKLRNDETLVISKGKNLYLVGGGKLGTLYAVYDFWEKYGKYRIYGEYAGAETFQKTKNVIWDGKTISTYPVFNGFRDRYGGRPSVNTGKFMLRNRNNCTLFHFSPYINPPYWGDFSHHFGSQHGWMLWVPSDKPLNLTGWFAKNRNGAKIKVEPWEPMYKKHPEYFSLDAKGNRLVRGQLCFSNPALRKLLTERFRHIAKIAGPGSYMLGSYDSHNTRYCYCEPCKKLMDKYQTNGGPLWDYIVELCNNIKDLPGVYVTSLVYKGWEQTEKAPVGIKKFPSNFIADAALLNAYCVPSQMKTVKMDNGKPYQAYKNLKVWGKICDHVSYWYYSNNVPLQGYKRMQAEFRELRAANVRSIGSCGVGGGLEFSDICHYMFFQLARNPEMDAEAAVKEIVAHKYGAAAEKMYGYMTELQNIHLDHVAKGNYTFGTEDTYEKANFLTGEQLVRWQKLFEEMLKLVKNDPRTSRNVRIARTGLDCWTTVYASKMRKACPDYKFDTTKVARRGLAACLEAEKAGMVRRAHNLARRVLETMEYYAFLKSDALPKELSKYNPAKVHLYLPERPMSYAVKSHALYKDAKAAAGVAMQKVFKPGKDGKIAVQIHDSTIRQWLPTFGIDSKKLNANSYTMVKVAECRLPPRGMLVFADAWGSSLDIRSLNRFYDPSYHERIFEYWASCRLLNAPKGMKHLLVDRVYLVEKGMRHELEAAADAKRNQLALPAELKNIPKDKIFQYMPPKDKLTVADPAAVMKYARKKVFAKLPAKIGISYYMPTDKQKWGRGKAIDLKTLKPGYNIVKFGTNKAYRNLVIVVNNDWGGPLDIRNIGTIFPDNGKKYTLYVSIKVDGKAISVDRLIFVKAE